MSQHLKYNVISPKSLGYVDGELYKYANFLIDSGRIEINSEDESLPKLFVNTSPDYKSFYSIHDTIMADSALTYSHLDSIIKLYLSNDYDSHKLGITLLLKTKSNVLHTLFGMLGHFKTKHVTDYSILRIFRIIGHNKLRSSISAFGNKSTIDQILSLYSNKHLSQIDKQILFHPTILKNNFSVLDSFIDLDSIKPHATYFDK